jgi:cyclopropane-fatty-acyl-phospholipid synthase
VRGVSLAADQVAFANERAREAGVADKVRFELTDYRDVTGKFDRITSVGMIEHVGQHNFAEYFAKTRELLADDGIMLTHTIGRSGPPGTTDKWTRKFIFPGGYIPGLSEIVTAIEDQGLWITDIEILRLHYAETCRHWRTRFLADPESPTLYDARFRRMWEFYLAGAELGFRYGGHMIFQIQVAKRVGTLPITRNYMLDR